MFRTVLAAAAVVATATLTLPVDAHTGHDLPAGIVDSAHLHLSETLVVGPSWLAITAIVALAVAVSLAVRVTRAARRRQPDAARRRASQR